VARPLIIFCPYSTSENSESLYWIEASHNSDSGRNFMIHTSQEQSILYFTDVECNSKAFGHASHFSFLPVGGARV
jgi:hypothetical protein